MQSQLVRLGQSDDEALPGWMPRIREKYNLEDSIQPRKKPTPTENSTRLRVIPREQDLITRREVPTLKRMVRKNRVNRLVKHFCIKMKRSVIGRQPNIEEGHITIRTESPLKKWLMETQGCSLTSWASSLFNFLSICSILSLLIVYSLTLVFSEIEKNPELFSMLRLIQLCALPVFSLEIFLNLITKRYNKGRPLVHLNQIAMNYVENKFVYDCINLAVLMADVILETNSVEMSIFRMVTVLKLREVLSKIEVLENLYITSFYREQYWGLLGVLLLNFTAAHILSLSLNAMSFLNSESNWLTAHGLNTAPWYERYVWGYYWGTTIMLTVGFGDLAATNYQQALCLIFIEMISCISLAYNINCVGNLVTHLRQQSLQKTHNLKTFQLMSKSHNVQKQLQSKINNYIEQSFLMKNEFNFKEQDQMLECLPQALKREYLKDVNKKVFRHLAFIKELTLGSQYLLAEHIIRKISHPDEIILGRFEPAKCIILHKGLLGMIARRCSDTKQPELVQTLSVEKNEGSKLLNLAFIKRRRQDYNLRSLTYCVIYFLENDDFQNFLRQNSLDYQHFCLLRDKLEIGINPDQLYPCEKCPTECHNRFQCPKLHYIPNHMMVTIRYLEKLRTSKQNRHRRPRYREKVCSMYVNHKFEIDDLKQLRSELEDYSGTLDNNDVVEGSLHSLSSQRLPTRQHSRENTVLYKQPTLQNFNSHNQMKSSQEMLANGKTYDMDLPFELDNLPAKYRDNNSRIVVHMIQAVTQTAKDFWNLQSDVMYNWRYYFAADNPDNLASRKWRGVRRNNNRERSGLNNII